MTELCARYGISRNTGYKWRERFLALGVPGLLEHSRAPRASSPVSNALKALRRGAVADNGTEPGVDDRLQGTLRHAGWQLLLSAHDRRSLQSLRALLPKLSRCERQGHPSPVAPTVLPAWPPRSDSQ